MELLGCTAAIHRNLPPQALYDAALKSDPGSTIAANGALVAFSGAKTGRCPKDKRVVEHAASKGDIWWGDESPNIPLSEASFQQNKATAAAFLSKLDDLYVQDGFVNWGPEVRLPDPPLTLRNSNAEASCAMMARVTVPVLMQRQLVAVLTTVSPPPSRTPAVLCCAPQARAQACGGVFVPCVTTKMWQFHQHGW